MVFKIIFSQSFFYENKLIWKGRFKKLNIGKCISVEPTEMDIHFCQGS